MMGKEANNTVAEVLTAVETTLDTDATTDIGATSDTQAIPDAEMPTQLRSLDAIQKEFRTHYLQGLESAYRMGELLNEAKAQLPEHGKWLDWLRTVNFKERQAQRLMLLAKSYSDTTTLSDLGPSKALALLKVGEDKRDEFIKESHMVTVKGVLMSTSVHNMSVRQLESVIQEHIGKSKKRAKQFPSPASDAIEASVPTSDLDRQFEHLQLCIDSLWEHIENLTDNQGERGKLTDKLCHLCQQALQRTQERTDGCAAC